MSKATALAALVGVTTCVALPVGAVAAAKKSHKVNVKASGGTITNGGTVQKGIKVTGKPFGGCTIDVVYNPPTVTQTWKCKHGRFRGRYTSTVNGDTVTGTAKLSKGTGTYKGISGSLKVKASLSKGTATLTGTAKY